MITCIKRLLSYFPVDLLLSANIFWDLRSFSYMSNYIGHMFTLTMISILSGSLVARSALALLSKNGLSILCKLSTNSILLLWDYSSSSSNFSAFEFFLSSPKSNHSLKSSSEEKIDGIMKFNRLQSSKRLF